MMKLTVLGSGTCIPLPNKNPSGYVLTTGRTKILLDSGSGTLRRLVQAGIKLHALDILAYTHFHLDHFSDFPAILFSMVNGSVKRTKKLYVIGPKGIIKFYKTYHKLFGKSIIQQTFKIEFRECKTSRFRLKNILFSTSPTGHTKNSISYRIEHGGKVFVYTGDTPFSNDIIAQSRDADLLLIECSLPDGEGVPGHLTPEQVGEIANRASAGKILLTHLYPHQNKRKILKSIKQIYSGKIYFAKDLSVY